MAEIDDVIARSKLASMARAAYEVFSLGEEERHRGPALALVHSALQEMVERLTNAPISREAGDLILDSAQRVKSSLESGTEPSEDFMRNGAEVMYYLNNLISMEQTQCKN